MRARRPPPIYMLLSLPAAVCVRQAVALDSP
jgi:hypothetical protein